MTERIPHDKDIATSTRAFDTFVGFIYATSIGLIIRGAYEKSFFNSFWSILLTFLLLAFFAQDWMVRFRGRHQMANTATVNPVPYYGKLIIEVSIAYFLLLAALRLVEIYAPMATNITLGAVLKAPFIAKSDPKVCYMMAMFAGCSWVWNIIMVDISIPITIKQIFRFLKGHLDNEILQQFPDFNGWISEYHTAEAEVSSKKVEADREFANKVIKEAATDIKMLKEHLTALQAHKSQIRIWLLVKHVLRKPHHLILPYLLVAHIIILNLVLCTLIFISSYFLGGMSILGFIVGARLISWFILILLISMSALIFLSSLFLGLHFRSKEKNGPHEQYGVVCLAIGILFCYLICPASVLICLIIAQQLAVNYLMTKHFEPPQTVLSSGKDAPEDLAPQAVQDGAQ